MTLLSNLPREIFQIIFQYLSLLDIGRIDLAILQHSLRPLYLEALCGLVIPKYEDCPADNDSSPNLDWILLRRITSSAIFVEGCFSSPQIQQLIHNSRSVLQLLTIKDLTDPLSSLGYFPCLKKFTLDCCVPDGIHEFLTNNTQIEMIEIFSDEPCPIALCDTIAHCPKLKCLILSENNWVDDLFIQELLKEGLNLNILDLRNTEVEHRESLEVIFNSCPNLHYLAVSNDLISLDFVEKCWSKIIQPALQSDKVDVNRWGLQCLRDNAFPDNDSIAIREFMTSAHVYSIVLQYLLNREETLRRLALSFLLEERAQIIVDLNLHQELLHMSLQHPQYIEIFDFLLDCSHHTRSFIPFESEILSHFISYFPIMMSFDNSDDGLCLSHNVGHFLEVIFSFAVEKSQLLIESGFLATVILMSDCEIYHFFSGLIRHFCSTNDNEFLDYLVAIGVIPYLISAYNQTLRRAFYQHTILYALHVLVNHNPLYREKLVALDVNAHVYNSILKIDLKPEDCVVYF